MERTCVSAVLRQLCGKIDIVRQCAGGVLAVILSQDVKIPNIPSRPHLAKVIEDANATGSATTHTHTQASGAWVRGCVGVWFNATSAADFLHL